MHILCHFITSHVSIKRAVILVTFDCTRIILIRIYRIICGLQNTQICASEKTSLVKYSCIQLEIVFSIQRIIINLQNHSLSFLHAYIVLRRATKRKIFWYIQHKNNNKNEIRWRGTIYYFLWKWHTTQTALICHSSAFTYMPRVAELAHLILHQNNVIGVGLCILAAILRVASSFSLLQIKARPRGYKTFIMLNSTEPEIFPAHKC